MGELCSGCDFPSWHVIAKFHGDFGDNSEAAVQFLRDHGVLPRGVECEVCKAPCHIRKDKHQWYCGRYRPPLAGRKKRRRCSFTSSDHKGTLLHNAHLEPWKILLFINHWLTKKWDHDTIFDNLKLSSDTSVKWRTYCSGVCEYWLGNQDPVGGEGVVVELDESLFVRRKLETNKQLRQIWMFGGIERESRKIFVVPFAAPSGKRDKSTLIPLIQQYVLPGSVVVSEPWGADIAIQNLGYTNLVAYRSKKSENPEAHTRNIKALWQDINELVKRPGMRIKYFWQYFARFLFLHKFREQRLHRFLIEVGRLYPPQSELPSASEPAGHTGTATPPVELDWSFSSSDSDNK